MSMLAEPRRKQRISVDPQNVGWRNSETVGKKLMTKMKWSEGQGLGKNEQGSADNLKLKANFSGKGKSGFNFLINLNTQDLVVIAKQETKSNGFHTTTTLQAFWQI
jgi:hypothetical protein